MKALPEYRGKVDEILLLTFLNSDGTPKDVLDSFSGILKAFHQHCAFTFIINFERQIPRDFRARLEEYLLDGPFQFRKPRLVLTSMLNLCQVIQSALLEIDPSARPIACEESDLLPSTIFAQDPFAVLEGDDKYNYLLSPIYAHVNFANSYIALNLANAAIDPRFMIRPCLYSFSAANILAGENYIVIGKDSVIENLGAAFDQENLVLDNFRQYYGVDHILEIGTEAQYPKTPRYAQGNFQPVYHLDLCITLAGPHQIVGLEIEEIAFVGELVLYDPEQNAVVANSDPLTLQIAQGLDEAAQQLDGQVLGHRRLKVVRIPLLLNLEYGNYLSWNNAICENHWPLPSRTIYLPDYCENPEKVNLVYQEYQTKAIDIMRQSGFEVTLVANNFLYYALNMRGSLHCMVKVLSRKGG